MIELLLYVALSATLITVISSFLATVVESRVRGQAAAEVEQQGLQVAQLVAHAIRNAQGINAPSRGTTGASLSLDVVDGASDPTVVDLSGGVLRMTEGSSVAVPLTNSWVMASNLAVANLTATGTPGSIRVQFTLTHANPSGRPEYRYEQTFTSAASLRD